MNIKDIALLSECSISTVSRVLNNHPYVSEEKKQRVLKVIAETDYAPNSKARELQAGKSRNIGVVVPGIDFAYFNQLISGILQAAVEQNYMVTLLPTNHDKDTEAHYFKQLKNKRFDGIIVASRVHELAEIEQFTQYGPIVCCEDTGSYQVASVFVDRLSAYSQVFQELKVEGVEKIGITLSRKTRNSNSAKFTYMAYERFFDPIQPEYIVNYCYDSQSGMEAGEYFSNLEESQRPEVIFTNNDEVAAGIYQIYQNKNLPVQIIGQLNMYLSEILQISTIDLHLQKIGYHAFNLLKNHSIEKVSFAPTYIRR
ncbi:LacI family DNA-binding transcriptional regulator [Carnobacterium gallinarum]|uniref:LacI family DNA-binding transcriptional regulator n=1 Tax=Carnobacterium gallinarum TaxID=2749 RepID=UPI0005531DF9|nr:LacI family DNA-binding transcriptional regulator [Carnobacterium gallinarum]